MLFTTIHRYPFIRLLIPLAAGIFCGDKLFFQGQSGWVASCLFSLFLFFFLFLFLFFFVKRYSCRWLFGVFLVLSCFMFGCIRVNKQLQLTDYRFPESETRYRVVVTEEPESKDRSVLCRVLLIEQRDSLSRGTALQHKALLYFSKDSLSGQLRCGDELLVSARISSPVNNGNPDEFDYARFLSRRQVSGTGYVSGGSWKLLSRDTFHSLRQKAANYRESILSVYRRLGFEGDNFAVLSALTIGDKEELSEDIRETFSVSGVSHVLALSGLHIGFLYALLWFGLKRLPGRWKITALLRTLLVIVLLWAFAFFTGMSASVVRSVLMFSLFALANLSGRENFSLNTLLAAAFFMLLVQPCWLFDVGFQLSFSAVASILLIQPRLYRLLPVKSRVWKYIWGLMTVSLAAQIGTVPLVLLYFSRFSTHFLLTNLLAIPLVSLIMYSAVIMLLMTPFPFVQSLIAVGVRGLVDLLNGCARWVEHLPWASIDGVWLYRFEVAGFYLVLFLWMRYMVVRSGRSLLVGLSCLLVVSTLHVVMSVHDRPRKSIVFYNVRNSPVVHCVNSDGHSWLAYADSFPDESRLYRAVSGYWNRLHLKKPQAITTDYTDSLFCFSNCIVSFYDRRICMVNDNRWQNKTAVYPLFIDYLYLCKGYEGRLGWLTSLFSIRNVVLDASLSDRSRQAYEEECRQLGIRFISLSEKGYARFVL